MPFLAGPISWKSKDAGRLGLSNSFSIAPYPCSMCDRRPRQGIWSNRGGAEVPQPAEETAAVSHFGFGLLIGLDSPLGL